MVYFYSFTLKEAIKLSMSSFGLSFTSDVILFGLPLGLGIYFIVFYSIIECLNTHSESKFLDINYGCNMTNEAVTKRHNLTLHLNQIFI